MAETATAVRVTPADLTAIDAFCAQSNFHRAGGVMTDLDGTALIERDGRVFIHARVEAGLAALARRGRPIIFNTLRFPLSVLDAFAREWLRVSGQRVALVALNGSSIGWLDARGYSEARSVTLQAAELDEVLVGVEGLVANGVDDLMLFIYRRDWTQGEIIWTPSETRVAEIGRKFPSAMSVQASTVAGLRRLLHAEPVLMVHLRIDEPGDDRPAYQHIRPSEFITHEGTDKLSGARLMADELGVELASSVGAGDTRLDTFLAGVGLGVHVRTPDLDFKALDTTLKVGEPSELGAVLERLAMWEDRHVGG